MKEKNKFVNSIEELLGNTPIIKLNKIFKDYNVYAKLEYYNPSFSIKDRAAFNMIEQKIRRGLIKKYDTIIEATSGNTGLGLCLASVVYELNFIAVIFDDVSQEKINMLKGYGATVIICDSKLNSDEVGGYVWVAKQISHEFSNIHYIDQFNNCDNPIAHYKSTGPELWNQLDGKIDIFINTIGTGGTISGISKYLKEKNPNIKSIGVEPTGGIYKDYFRGKKSEYKNHLIHSISDNFISSNFDKDFIDDIIQVDDKESFKNCIDMMREEGLCIGTSGGCTISAIKKYINDNDIDKDACIVCTIADSGIKYCDSLMNLEYLKNHNLDYSFMNTKLESSDIIENYLNKLGINIEVK